MNKISIAVGALGIVILVVASILGFRVIPDIINKKIEEEVSLIPQSDTWEKWEEITRPIYFNVYVFNVTNVDDYEKGAYPYLQELGPYAYKQIRRKVNLTQPDGDRSVVYEQQVHYVFDQEKSGNNSEDDLVNVINVPFISVLTVINRTLGPVNTGLVSNVLFRFESVIRRNVSVGDLIFYGMDVSNITAVLSNPPFDQTPIPDEFQGNLFGIYRGRNGSTDGIYKIHTGVGDSSKFGEIITWNGKSDLGLWQQFSQCDKINGSDGTLFPPFVDKGRIMQIFSSDLCRSLYLTYQKEVEVKGIKGYRFTVPKEALQDPRVNPSNQCFCNEPDPNDCLQSGVIDISTCRNGAPMVLSTPYFLDGEAIYSEHSGIWPNREWHETIIDVEPNSGVLLNANKRIQVNVNYKAYVNGTAMANTKDLIFPLMWIDESAELPEESAQELKDTLLSPKSQVVTWRWVGVGVGIALILAGIGIYVWKG